MNSCRSFYQCVDRDTEYSTTRTPAEHPFYQELNSFIFRYSLKNMSCLEIGSSKGIFQDIVENYTGVDIAESLAHYYHKTFYVVADARLPFADGSFDAIFTYATHEHIPDIETALEEIIRVLKPGGVCLFAPAWHSRPWFAQGYTVRPYSDLPWKGKLIKLSIPFRDFFLIRWPFILLRRLVHFLLYLISPHNIPLRYRKLTANYEKFWQSDSDACNSLDPFDVILWLKSRGLNSCRYGGLITCITVRTVSLEILKPLNIQANNIR